MVLSIEANNERLQSAAAREG